MRWTVLTQRRAAFTAATKNAAFLNRLSVTEKLTAKTAVMKLTVVMELLCFSFLNKIKCFWFTFSLVFLHPGDGRCSSGEFQCSNGQCVSINMRCDSYPDCQDHSDEDGCVSQAECVADQLHCLDNQQCVLQEWICDGENDCKDMSDEQVTLMFMLRWGMELVLLSLRGSVYRHVCPKLQSVPVCV